MARRRAPIVNYTTEPTERWRRRDLEWPAELVRRYVDAWSCSAEYVVTRMATSQAMGCGPRSPSYAFARAGLIIGFPGGRVVRIPYRVLITAGRHQLTLWDDPAADDAPSRPDAGRAGS